MIAAEFLGALFEEVANTDTISHFATVGGLSDRSQGFATDYLVSVIIEKFPVFEQAVRGIYPKVTMGTYQPYITEAAIPNVLSPLHLITQALCSEYVSSLRNYLTLSHC